MAARSGSSLYHAGELGLDWTHRSQRNARGFKPRVSFFLEGSAAPLGLLPEFALG